MFCVGLGGVCNDVRDVLAEVLAIKQRGRLLERPVLRLDDHEVEEDELERVPAAVYNLVEDGRQVNTQKMCTVWGRT